MSYVWTDHKPEKDGLYWIKNVIYRQDRHLRS